MIRSFPVSILLTLIFAHSFGKTIQPQTADTLVFSGYTWIINAQPSSPGPNYWNNKNAWVDGRGRLHLKIYHNPLTQHWECAGIHTLQTFGNGTYEWQVQGAVDRLDPNIVLGMFNYSGNDGYDETDIEITRWGEVHADNLHYTVWPQQGAHVHKQSDSVAFGLQHRFSAHRFQRRRGSIEMESFSDKKYRHRIFYKKFNEQLAPVSDLRMSVHINFWLYNGLAPLSNKNAEVIIKSFKFSSLDE